MKKISVFCFCLLIMLLSGFYAFGASCDSFKGSNEDAHNYSVWADTVKSYLHNCDDGRLMKVQYLANENKLLAEYYNDNLSRTSLKTINLKLPLFGGFYAVGDSYFVLTGQENPSELSSVTCFAVTKYDKNWNEKGTAELKDCNTTVPFRAGSARFCHSGSYLIVRTSHEMYTSAKDGLRHQANLTFQLDMNSMKITDSHTSVASVNYGYVSHSFNQFVKIESDKIVALDHGDAYPRSVVLLKYKTSVSSGKFVPSYSKPCTAIDVLPISGAVGANQTGCSVGGFEITSAGYLAAMNSIKQGSSSVVRDIYLAYVPSGGTAAETKKLTSYTTAGASTPQLVKIDSNNFMVLWSYNGRVHYCKVDSKGNMTSSICSFDGSLSDCQPIVRTGKVIWYVWNDGETAFYSIDPNNITAQEKVTFTAGHSYSAVSVSGTAVEMKCSDCGKVTKGNTPSAFYLYWEIYSSDDGMSVTYSSAPEGSYHPDKTVGIMPKYTSANLNEFEVVSSDESVVAVTYKAGGCYAEMKGEGTAKVTIKSAYNPSVKRDYTIKVAHSWSVINTVVSTCTADGKTVKICSVCDETKTEIKSATGHKMGEYSVVKTATCKSVGSEKSTCNVCGFTETREIPKTDHDKKITVEAVAPTCTKQGKTAGKKCSVCGKITVEQESVEALGHDLGEYKITKAPTCTAQGEETATCTRCTYSKTQSVARIAHTEVAVKAVAPTCTKQGKTAGKKCSVCGKTTVEQESVEALGHELGEYEITKEPTCTAKGEKTAKCIRCTHTETADIAKTAHTEVNVKAVKAACTKQGKTAGKKCSVCGKTTVEQESVEALGHELGEYEITKEPTCTAKGEKTASCTRCAYTKTDDVAKIAHTEVTVKAVKATCTKQGKTAGKKCSVCGKTTVEQESVEALGHDLGDYEITKEPTCTAKGEKRASCTRCAYTKTDDVAKIAHTEVTVKAVKATCTKNGKTKGSKCSQCNKVIVAQESIEALGHSKKTTVLAKATTKANGKKSTVCERCGKDYGETRIYRIQSVTLSKTKYTCDGKAKTPSVTVIDYNKDQLIKDKDYTVTYQNGRKDPGKYTVTVKFKGSYSGKVTLSFEIKPAKPAGLTASAAKKAVNLKWNKVTKADGYQVWYSTSEKGTYKKLTDTAKLTFKKSGLTSGKKYYFKVRAYKKTDAGTIYSSYSAVRSVKIK